MPFTVQLSGFTLGVSILNVDLYGCTGTTSACTGGTINDLTNYFQISGHTNIGRNDLNGRFVVVPDDIKTIKVVPSNLNDGGCVLGTDFNFIRLNTPLTPTPTSTPTVTPTPGLPCLAECSILFNNSVDIFSYDFSLNTSTYLNPFISGFIPGSSDIAHTSNKIFMYTNNQIYEYIINYHFI